MLIHVFIEIEFSASDLFLFGLRTVHSFLLEYKFLLQTIDVGFQYAIHLGLVGSFIIAVTFALSSFLLGCH